MIQLYQSRRWCSFQPKVEPHDVVKGEEDGERAGTSEVVPAEVQVARDAHRVLPDEYELHHRQTVEARDR